MMKYLLIIFLGILTTCLSDQEPNDIPINSQYKGNWVGNFNGDLSGTIVFTVNDSGNMKGTVHYDNADFVITEEILGQVLITGKFDLKTKTYLRFSGYLLDKTSDGKWIKDNFTGNFNFKKK